MDSLCLQPLFLRILYLCGVFLKIICFIVPIILIVKLIMDIYKQIINPDDKDFKGKITNRIVACIIIFLVPTIISLLFSFIEKVVATNSYSDISVCREFANIEHIKVLEEEMDKIEIDKYNDEKYSNLSAYEKKVQAVRDYVAKNQENLNNNQTNNSNSSNNTQSGNSNLSGKLQTRKYSNWNYYLYVPDNVQTGNKPLVVFLHGSGERGSNISSLERYGFAKYIKNGSNYNAVILIPQLASGEEWDTGSNRNKLMNLINQVVNEYSIDRSRISISGFSLGTVPIPNLLKENSNYFSSVVLIALCGSGDSRANYFKNIPTRVYFGSNDTSCSTSNTKSFVNALKKINNDVDLTVYNNKPHNVVDLVFQDGSVLNWMISKQKN